MCGKFLQINYKDFYILRVILHTAVVAVFCSVGEWWDAVFNYAQFTAAWSQIYTFSRAVQRVCVSCRATVYRCHNSYFHLALPSTEDVIECCCAEARWPAPHINVSWDAWSCHCDVATAVLRRRRCSTSLQLSW